MEDRYPLSSLGLQIKAYWRKYRPNCRPRGGGRGICSGPNRMVRAALSITDFGGVCRGIVCPGREGPTLTGSPALPRRRSPPGAPALGVQGHRLSSSGGRRW